MRLCQNPLKFMVVVIVVIVFVKKIGPRNIWSKNNPCPKYFRSKSVGSNKKLGKKKLGPKKFRYKKWTLKKSGTKNFGSQLILVSTNFWVQQILGTKILGKMIRF